MLTVKSKTTLKIALVGLFLTFSGYFATPEAAHAAAYYYPVNGGGSFSWYSCPGGGGSCPSLPTEFYANMADIIPGHLTAITFSNFTLSGSPFYNSYWRVNMFSSSTQGWNFITSSSIFAACPQGGAACPGAMYFPTSTMLEAGHENDGYFYKFDAVYCGSQNQNGWTENCGTSVDELHTFSFSMSGGSASVLTELLPQDTAYIRDFHPPNGIQLPYMINWIANVASTTPGYDYTIDIKYTGRAQDNSTFNAFIWNARKTLTAQGYNAQFVIPPGSAQFVVPGVNMVWTATSTLINASGTVLDTAASTFIIGTSTALEFVLCDFGDFGCYLQKMFIPTNGLSAFNDLGRDFGQKPPFGYFTGITAALNGLQTSSTGNEELASSSLASFAGVFAPLRTGLTWLLWVVFCFWTIKRFSHLEL